MLSGMARAGGLAATSSLAAAASAAVGGLAAQLLPAAATAASRLLQRRGAAWSVEREPQVQRWAGRLHVAYRWRPARASVMAADHIFPPATHPPAAHPPLPPTSAAALPQTYKSVDDIIQDHVIVENLEKTREAAKDPARIRDILAAAKERSFLTDHKPGGWGGRVGHGAGCCMKGQVQCWRVGMHASGAGHLRAVPRALGHRPCMGSAGAAVHVFLPPCCYATYLAPHAFTACRSGSNCVLQPARVT